jgi:hypothetical protein
MPSTATDRRATAPLELFTPAGYARLLGSPRGRAFHLSWMAHAEEADEGVFDRLLARVDVPELNRMVAIHANDEKRHADLLRQCVARVGVAPEENERAYLRFAVEQELLVST